MDVNGTNCTTCPESEGGAPSTIVLVIILCSVLVVCCCGGCIVKMCMNEKGDKLEMYRRYEIRAALEGPEPERRNRTVNTRKVRVSRNAPDLDHSPVDSVDTKSTAVKTADEDSIMI